MEYYKDQFLERCYLLFIYTNDRHKDLERCKIVLYADDTLIFSDDKTDKVCLKFMR